jgi:FkbM family methyltransferase
MLGYVKICILMKNIKHPIRYLLSFFSRPTLYNSYYGVRFSFDASFVSPWIRDAIYKGFYECDECKLLQSFLEPTDIVLEIGAGIGLTSAIVSSKVQYSKHIEANPELISLISVNIGLNSSQPDFHTVAEAAVTALPTSNEQVPLHMSDNFWNAALAQRDVHNNSIAQHASFFGDLVRERNYTFLIMDIEGYELEILSNNTIPQGIKKIMIELHPKAIGYSGVSSCISILRTQGFDAVANSGNSFCLQRLN